MSELIFHPVSDPPELGSLVLAKTTTFPGYQVLWYKMANRDAIRHVGVVPIYDDPHNEACEVDMASYVLEWAFLEKTNGQEFKTKFPDAMT